MELKMKYYLIIFTSLLLAFVSCSTKQKNILQNEDFNVVLQKAIERELNFCIVLLDTTDLTSKIYMENLLKINKNIVFNLVYSDDKKSNWYKEWLYTNSTPITCIFTSTGRLVDIIPGASRKCFNCINNTIDKGLMCDDLKYYNNFSMEKNDVIPLLDEIIQCKFSVDKGVNVSSRIDSLLDSIKYPYITYLKMINSLNIEESEDAQSAAKQLLSYNDDLELEIYPKLFSFAKGVIDPNYNSKIEPVLECQASICLDNCVKDVAKPFKLEISNTGETPLEILDIQLDCSCVSLNSEKKCIILPRESQTFNFEFIANKEGKLIREVFIKSNGIQPIKRVKIVANCLIINGEEVI